MGGSEWFLWGEGEGGDCLGGEDGGVCCVFYCYLVVSCGNDGDHYDDMTAMVDGGGDSIKMHALFY